MVVKAFGAEEPDEARRFREAARRLLQDQLQYVLQQALSSPLIELLGARCHRGAAVVRAGQILVTR